MKHPFRRFWPRPRQYPVQYDEDGRSIRQICFEEFDRGKRPVEVMNEHGFERNTVLTYWKQWKKLPKNWHEKRKYLRMFKKGAPDFLYDAALRAGKQLGMSRQEVFTELDKPYGLLGLISGKWQFIDTTAATNEAIAILNDMMTIIFIGRFQNEHVRTILRNLEAEGIDFTKKRMRLNKQDASEELDDIKSKDQIYDEDSDDE